MLFLFVCLFFPKQAQLEGSWRRWWRSSFCLAPISWAQALSPVVPRCPPLAPVGPQWPKYALRKSIHFWAKHGDFLVMFFEWRYHKHIILSTNIDFEPWFRKLSTQRIVCWYSRSLKTLILMSLLRFIWKEWKNGKKNGHGTFAFPSGFKYVGEYKVGKMWNVKKYNSEENWST